MPPRAPSTIEFSRVLGVAEVAAIGFSVSLPIALFIGGEIVLESAGAEAPLLFLLAAAIFLLLGFRPTQAERGAKVRQAALVAVIGLALLVVPLGLTTLRELREQRIRDQLERTRELLGDDRIQSRSFTIRKERGVYVIQGRIWAFDEIPESEFESFRRALEEEAGVPIRIRATVVRATVTDVGPEFASETEE